MTDLTRQEEVTAGQAERKSPNMMQTMAYDQKEKQTVIRAGQMAPAHNTNKQMLTSIGEYFAIINFVADLGKW